MGKQEWGKKGVGKQEWENRSGKTSIRGHSTGSWGLILFLFSPSQGG